MLTALLPYHTSAWQQLGTNDVTGSNTATMQTSYLSLWSQIKAGLSGRQHLSQFKLTPKVVSTDGTTTLANQTPNTGFAAGGQRDQLNFWFSIQAVAFTIDQVIDCSTCIEAPTDATKWVLRNFTTTLGAAYVSGGVVSLNAVPRYLEEIVISPSASPSTGAASAISFTGTSAPFSVTCFGSPSGPGAALNAAVSATASFDGTHPSGCVYRELMVPALLNQWSPRG